MLKARIPGRVQSLSYQHGARTAALGQPGEVSRRLLGAREKREVVAEQRDRVKPLAGEQIRVAERALEGGQTASPADLDGTRRRVERGDRYSPTSAQSSSPSSRSTA